MAETVSSTLVTEKNKLNSTGRWLQLLECKISSTQAIRIVRDVESFTFDGKIYYPAALDIREIHSTSDGTLSNLNITASNISGELRSLVETYAFDGQIVTLRVCHSSSGSAANSIAYRYQIANIQMNWPTITFVLQIPNLLNKQFPINRFQKQPCQWIYKGKECGYIGPLATCSKFLFGNNGCEDHGTDEVRRSFPQRHPKNYGAFPTIPDVR